MQPSSSLYHTLIQLCARHKTYTALVFVSLSLISIYITVSAPKETRETYTITSGALYQYVNGTGALASSKDASLSFQTTGEVAFVGVKTGDFVKAGQILATLSASDAQSSVLQAEGALASAEATLAQLKQGSRKEELALKEQAVTNAKNSLSQAYDTLPDVIQNVDAVTADVVQNKFAPLFTTASGRYMVSFASCDQGLSALLETKRANLDTVLSDFQKKSSTITVLSQDEALDDAYSAAYASALATNDFVNTASALLLSRCSITNSALDIHRTMLTQVKSTMTALFSDLTAKRSLLSSSKNALNQATRDLELLKAGTDPYRIKVQEALVVQSQAALAQAKSLVRKTTIVAPFSGSVSAVNLSLGETVTLGKPVITMLVADSLEVKVNIPEIDIVKIAAGSPAEITLDAYGKGEIFKGVVSRIDPKSRDTSGIPSYETTITLLDHDVRLKEGMTANIHIMSEKKEGVLVIPARFVSTSNGKDGSVTLLSSGKEVIKTIGVGVRGAEGMIEVTSGLLPGDVVVPPKTLTRQAQKRDN